MTHDDVIALLLAIITVTSTSPVALALVQRRHIDNLGAKLLTFTETNGHLAERRELLTARAALASAREAVTIKQTLGQPVLAETDTMIRALETEISALAKHVAEHTNEP